MEHVEMESETPRDLRWYARQLFTIPNAMTAYRFFSAPKAYREARDLREAPKKNLLRLALRSVTDLEGNVARMENLPRIGKTLARLGFRTSEIGRQGDPVADTVYGGAGIAGALRSEVLPRHFAISALAQRAVKSAITISATLEGKELEVKNLGKVGEFLVSVGAPIYMAAETTTNESLKTAYRLTGGALITGGFVCASAATVELAQQAGYIDAPRLQSFFDLANAALDPIVPGR